MNPTSRKLVAASAMVLAFCVLAGAQAKADNRVKILLDKIGQEYIVDGDGDYEIEVEVGEDRYQYVYVASGTEKYGGVEIREIWSEAGSFPEEPDQATLLDLLSESDLNKIGCWAIAPQDDGTYLLYYTIKLPVSFTASDLKMMLAFVGEVADAREDQFFGTDEY